MKSNLAQTITSADGTTIGFQSFGAGDGLILLGGALRAARDYVSFAEELSRSFTVHVMERRGRVCAQSLAAEIRGAGDGRHWWGGTRGDPQAHPLPTAIVRQSA